MRGVVEGVRDYGNRMGIPTVNGAVFFDRRYLGNPLVYCGNVGLIPRDKSFKETQPGDLIVAIGGRTGRDGIHGATFSSAELTHESESLSGGAVQIGNAIEEKKVLDVLLAARDRGLYTAVTDCGAGGFSSAVGEMGEKLGAEVHLDRAPVKYAGLVVHRNLDLRSPGADGPQRARGQLAGAAAAVRERRRRSHGHRPLRADGPAGAEVQRRNGRRPVDAVPPRGPPAGRPAERTSRPRVASSEPRHKTGPREITPTTCSASSPPPTSPAKNGSSASTTTKCKAAASSSRSSASRATAPATPPSSAPCSPRAAASSSPAA